MLHVLVAASALLPSGMISRVPVKPRVAIAATSPSPSPPPLPFFLRNAAVRIGCSSAASAGTWALVRSCGMSSVAASSAIGLAAGAILPTPLATAAFCGTFVGMSSDLVAPGPADAALLGAAAAALLAALDASNTRLLKGYGGRLGAVAALSCAASMLASPSLRAAGLLMQPSLALAATAPKALLTTVGASVAGSAVMRLWARRLAVLLIVSSSSSLLAKPTPGEPSKRKELAKRLSNPVASASVVGLLASAVLGSSRATVAASVFTGAFVAMSAPDKLGSTRSLLGAAALAGLVQAGLAAFCVGAGGKLGASAAIGVLLARSLRAAAAVVLLWRARAE